MMMYSSILKSLNKESKRIMDIIIKKGPITKNTLSVMSNMKLSTLNRVMEPLKERKLIIHSGVGPSTGGRMPVLFDSSVQHYYFIGIDISRTYTQVIITNLKMNIVSKQRFTMDESCTPEKTVSLISQSINSLLTSASINKKMIVGVGVGTVGPLNRESGIINPVNFTAPGWSNTPIKALLEKEVDLPVVIDNGANCAVLCELFFGKGKDFCNIAYFNCGIGIRTGAVSSGTLIRSINDLEDAFGHMIIDVDGEKCSCGNYGCLECYSSAASITKKFVSEIKKGRTSSITKPLEKIDFSDICDAAEKDDELSKNLVIEAASIFGTGLSNYINLLNPELVIISGPLIKHSNVFYNISTDIARKKCYNKNKDSIIFSRRGKFGDDAISIGACAMALQNILN